MFKSLGLGICCLTLSIAGVTRASAIQMDYGKYGDDYNKNKHMEQCEVTTEVDFKTIDLKMDKYGKDNKDNKDCRDDSKDYGKKIDYSKSCKIDWHMDNKPLHCDDKYGKNCEVIDRCDIGYGEYDHKGNCDPHMVPAPSAAAFGGLGIAGVMLMAGLRKRRTA
jgi:hypothetical protein